MKKACSFVRGYVFIQAHFFSDLENRALNGIATITLPMLNEKR